MVRPRTLVLTLTRRCQRRCALCPTAKEGMPDLDPAAARRAVAWFAEEVGGGDVKLFGGEPLLNPVAVRAALDEAAARPEIGQVWLSTNGMLLDGSLLAEWAGNERLHPVLSIDGAPEDHDRQRGGGYADLARRLDRLRELPRLSVAMTIGPRAAARADRNLLHLAGLGFRSVNLLPAYLVPWTASEVTDLRRAFARAGRAIRAEWAAGRTFHLRNLDVRAEAPFVNAGPVVDCDGSIHGSNAGLAVPSLLARTRLGSLDDPPSPALIDEAATRTADLLRSVVPRRAWLSTLAVDAVLTELCDALVPVRGAA